MSNPLIWMQELINRVTDSVTPFDSATKLACHFFYSTGFDEWEVTLFPDSSQFGGRLADYLPANPQFDVSSLGESQITDALSVDAFDLMQVFSSITDCSWQTKIVASDDDVGPHLSVEGEFEGNNVWLRIASNPPSQLLNAAPCDRNTQRVK